MLVDGRLLIDGGGLVGVDEAALLEAAERAAAALVRRTGIASRLTR